MKCLHAVPPAMTEDWRDAVRAHRERRDAYFGGDPHSPLPEHEREAFDGLDYYPVDADYRFVVPLDEHAEKETVTVGTSTGGEQDYIRWGAFRVAIAGEDVTVQAYRPEPSADRLWVPFRDATSGDATYGAGRYVDLEEPDDRTEEGDWVLDFNLAYNPTCAYSDQYECPLPPPENWLDVPIGAGEKAYR